MAERTEAEAVSSHLAGHPSGDVEEALLRAEQVAMAILEQAEAQAREDSRQRQGAGDAEAARTDDAWLKEVREEARAQAEQIVAEAQRAAAALLRQARAEADLLRSQAIAVMERVTAMVVDHAYEVAESEAKRVREDAIQEAEEVKAAIIASARKQAMRIRFEAERQKPGRG